MKRIMVAACLAVLCIHADLLAQRGRRGGRGGGEGPAAAPSAPVETPPLDQKPKHFTAIVGGDVYVGTGELMTGATVLIGDSRIYDLGHHLELPEGTKVIDAKGKIVCPGFVMVTANGMGAGRSAPFLDSVNPYDPEIKQGLAAGITAFLAGQPGTANTPGGDTAVIKLAWGEVTGMVMKDGAVLGMGVPIGAADLEKLREQVTKAKEHRTALEEFAKKKAADPNAKPPAEPPGSDKILKVLAGEAKLWISLGGGGGRRGARAANDADAIRQAMEIAKLFGTGVVLQRPLSAWLMADEIAATGSMAILCPRDRLAPDPANPDQTGSNIASAAILSQAGVPVGITCPAGGFGGGAGVGTGGILGQDLNTPQIDAAFAVRGGLENRKALRTITLDAARCMGADARIGSIEKGKDADVLILDGDPLHYRTFVETALVNGKVVYEKDKEPFYSHIQR
jgi:imidazolonepropionase-like amidohydrolase